MKGKKTKDCKDRIMVPAKVRVIKRKSRSLYRVRAVQESGDSCRR